MPGAIRAQSLATPVILSVLNVHVILLFQTNKPDDDDDDLLLVSAYIHKLQLMIEICCSEAAKLDMKFNAIVSLRILGLGVRVAQTAVR